MSELKHLLNMSEGERLRENVKITNDRLKLIYNSLDRQERLLSETLQKLTDIQAKVVELLTPKPRDYLQEIGILQNRIDLLDLLREIDDRPFTADEKFRLKRYRAQIVERLPKLMEQLDGEVTTE